MKCFELPLGSRLYKIDLIVIVIIISLWDGVWFSVGRHYGGVWGGKTNETKFYCCRQSVM